MIQDAARRQMTFRPDTTPNITAGIDAIGLRRPDRRLRSDGSMEIRLPDLDGYLGDFQIDAKR